MDDITRTLLVEWGLSSFIPSFKEADIDQSALESLALPDCASIVAQLIPSLGKRAIFISQLKKYISLNNLETSCDTELEVATMVDADITFLNESQVVNDDSTEGLALHNETPKGKIIVTTKTPDTERVGSLRQRKSPRQSLSDTPRRKKIMKKKSATAPSRFHDLPPLTPALERAKARGELQLESRLFIKHFAEHLLDVTEGKPTAQDYQSCSMAIIAAYPEFKDISEIKPNASLVMRLSHHIRNRRHEAKKKATAVSRKSVYDAADVAGPSSQSHNTSKDHLLLELFQSGKKASSHVKLLLKNTRSERSAAVRNFVSCWEIVEAFPHLQNFEMFLYDLKLGVPTASYSNFEAMVGKLMKISPKPMKEKLSDVQVLELIVTVLTKLNPKTPKGNRKLITLEQAQGPPDLTSSELQAPCVAVYHKADAITDAFLLLEGRVVCQGVAPTAEQVVSMLLGAYFVMHRSYPKPYVNSLTFLERTYLQLNENPGFRGSISYNKLIQQFNSS